METERSEDRRLTISNLTKSYGSRTAVEDISFELRRGVTALVGPNGAGKSTIIRCIAGLIDWNGGDIVIDGVDARQDPLMARAKVGYLPERAAFPPDVRVATYLNYAAAMKGVRRVDRYSAVDDALALLDLKPVASRLVSNLSKGYRQRVGLAQAIIGSPFVLVLDEPLAGIDPLHIWDFRDVLAEYASDHIVLLSTHMIPEARVLCDRVLVVADGRIVFDGSLIEAELTGSVSRRWRLGVMGSGGAELKAAIERVGAAVVYFASSGASSNLVIDVADPAIVEALVREIVANGWSLAHLEPMTDLIDAALEGIRQSRPSAIVH